MERYLGIILIIIITLFAKNILQPPAILGDSSSPSTEALPANQPVTTQSSFTQKLQDEAEVIPKKTIYQDDPETEAGEEKVLDEGEDGKKTKIVKITYLKNGEEYQREIVSVETTEPKDEKILRGTKIVWRTLDAPDGQITYWKKLHVFATYYDPTSGCRGCSGRGITATGLKAGKGVVAVDPSIIKLGTQIYVPGYGKGIAGDTGGDISGNIIDLGFDDAKTSGWTAHFVDIYLL